MKDLTNYINEGMHAFNVKEYNDGVVAQYSLSPNQSFPHLAVVTEEVTGQVQVFGYEFEADLQKLYKLSKPVIAALEELKPGEITELFNGGIQIVKIK